MSFARFVVVLCAGYLFYYLCCFLWDFFLSGSSHKTTNENVVFKVNSENTEEPEDIDEEDYTFSEDEKNSINMKIVYDNVESQGLVVNNNLLSTLRSEASEYLKNISGLT